MVMPDHKPASYIFIYISQDHHELGVAVIVVPSVVVVFAIPLVSVYLGTVQNIE